MELLEVDEVASYVNDLFQADPLLRDLWVHGEVGDLTRAASGHLYFSLRGQGAQLRCVLFRGHLPKLMALPALGDAVILHGAMSFYQARGSCDLLVDQVYPEGMGLARIQLEALRRRLEEEGLFEPARKRPLPSFPRAIGVVSSESGAVIHDVLTVLARRFPLAEVIFAPASVQGEQAPAEVVAALARLNRYAERERLDLIVVARGGGSEGELSCFNDERVVRAAFASKVPLVSAIGHETDYTLLDLVADLRAPTPSAAAELITPDVAVLRRELAEDGERLVLAMRERLRLDRLDLDGLRERLLLRSPLTETARRREQVAALSHQAERALRHRLELARRDVESRAQQLHALSPRQTLQRGYSLVCGADGAPLRSWRAARPGDELAVWVADGLVDARVEAATPRALPENGARASEEQDAAAAHV